MAEAEDVNTIRRRSRRRLVGAIALVLAAVIVLPMVFDSEPRSTQPPVSVRIPGEDESAFNPKLTTKAGPVPAAQKSAAGASPQRPEKAPGNAAPKAPAEEAPAQAGDKAGGKPRPEIARAGPAEKPVYAPPQEQARAQAALLDARFYVPVGAYLEPGAVIQKLKTANLPFYAEPLATQKGQVTRVRVGPFGSREEADKALERLKELGFKPGQVASKS
jgi:DedD protein